ncbi:hypothetical protein LAU_0085 [Lausannevirus]|uniref:Uncharacterized protein n=2 Tax=Lausannevirus TaxID=999883 RepID=A0A0N7G2C9_9VIRU|nr:hypothetical protein LAU_0085 [Lausannevirus]AEA06938.1 hypothetical protein LAU_0085 [Lausannevirus]ALH06776.1 hypothetical protein PMV_078 [Port-miou virus]
MESEILPVVQDILETKYAVSKDDYKVTLDAPNDRHLLRFGVIKETSFRVSLKEYDRHICTWTELHSKDGNVIYYLERDVRKKENTVALLDVIIGDNESVKKYQRETLLKLRERNSFLEQENEKLRQKNRKMRYAPGGKGYEKTKGHFIGLI